MRGMKGITEMMMEMVLVLMVLMKSSMETPEGGWKSLPEVAPAAFPPLRSSPAAAFCLSVSGFVFLRRPLSKNPEGPFI